MLGVQGLVLRCFKSQLTLRQQLSTQAQQVDDADQRSLKERVGYVWLPLHALTNCNILGQVLAAAAAEGGGKRGGGKDQAGAGLGFRVSSLGFGV